MRNPAHLCYPLRSPAYLVILLLVITGMLSAEQHLQGESRLRTLWRVQSLGTALGPAMQGEEGDPLALLLVPHRNGRVEQPSIAGSGGIALDGSGGGGALALSLPASIGVVTGATGLYRDDDGLYWRGDVGLSRPLGRTIDGGVSVTGAFGSSTGWNDTGLMGNVGLQYSPGTTIPLRGLVLQGGLLNAGKTVRRNSGEVPIFPAFSPYLGLAVTPVENRDLSLSLSGGVTFERFQGIAVESSVALAFAGGTESYLGFRHRFASDESGVWPGISLGFTIPLGAAKERVRGGMGLQPTRDGTALAGGFFLAGLPSGDLVSPNVDYTVEGTDTSGEDSELVILGPMGGQRQIAVEITGEDDRSIAAVGARLTTRGGELLREWHFSPRGTSFPEGTVTDRLSSPLWLTRFAGTAVWDISDAPQDGFYSFDIAAWDAAGNRTERRAFEILVDTTPPDLKLRQATLDGLPIENIPGESTTLILKETQTLVLSVGLRDAESFAVSLLDEAGRPLFPLRSVFTGTVDESGYEEIQIRWDGVDPDGNRLPDGAYRIEAEASDYIGNRQTIMTEPVLVEGRRGTFSIATNAPYIAPGSGADNDRLRIFPTLEPVEGLREWRIQLSDSENDAVLLEWSGIDLPPEMLVLGEETLSRDGSFTVTGRSLYANGTRAEAAPIEFVVDSTAPRVELALSKRVVRPEEGRDVILFFESDNTAVTAVIEVEALNNDEAADSQVSEIAVLDGLPDTWVWQLTDEKGTLLPPGVYRLRVSAADAAGNRGTSQYREIVLQERLDGVSLVVPRRIFSPNGDRRFDEVEILTDGGQNLRRGTFVVRIEPAEAANQTEPARIFRGALPLPTRIVWDGRDQDGVVVTDGLFLPQIEVVLDDGTTVQGTGELVKVHTVAPAGTVELLGETIVSPDGDGFRDTIDIALSYTQMSVDIFQSERLHLLRQLPDGTEVEASALFPGISPGVFTWRPQGVDRQPLPDGEYRIQLERRDAVGNVGRSTTASFQVDTRPVNGFVRLSAGAVAPAGDIGFRNVMITPVLTEHDRLTSWEMRIVDTSGQAVLQRSGDKIHLPTQFKWPEEISSEREYPADGSYIVQFSAIYEHGPVLERQSPEIIVDGSGPIVEVSTAPALFSPDGDGLNDILEFSISATDRLPVRYWHLEIFDPAGEFFYDRGGEGPPPETVLWDGAARNGELVTSAADHRWQITVADILGNVTIAEGILKTDILVEAYQEGYRIQIPSIIFPPNSARLVLDGDDPAAVTNRDVLDRLSRIFRRFPDYRIVVEGHAVNLSGTQREEELELIPLSRERAVAVRNALISMGVPSGMIRAEGRGGTIPMVPHSDEVMRWKNRRVDFILQRER